MRLKNKFSVLVFALTSLLSGCTLPLYISACADAKATRPSKPMDGYFVIDLEYNDLAPIQRTVHCEEYYDAQCSLRGNYWNWREINTENRSITQKVFLNDERYGQVSVLLPSCSTLVKVRDIKATQLVFEIGGGYVYIQKVDGSLHTYRATKSIDEMDKEIEFDFRFSVEYKDST